MGEVAGRPSKHGVEQEGPEEREGDSAFFPTLPVFLFELQAIEIFTPENSTFSFVS